MPICGVEHLGKCIFMHGGCAVRIVSLFGRDGETMPDHRQRLGCRGLMYGGLGRRCHGHLSNGHDGSDPGCLMHGAIGDRRQFLDSDHLQHDDAAGRHGCFVLYSGHPVRREQLYRNLLQHRDHGAHDGVLLHCGGLFGDQ